MTTELRKETASAHAAAELVIFPSLDSERGCTDGYRRFLQTMYAFHCYAERIGVDSFATEDAWLLLRSALIEVDAVQLGIELPAPAELAADVAGPTLEGDQLAGLAYVVAGSALGGQVISRQIPEGLPRAYLTNAGRPVGPAWRSFTRTFDGIADSWDLRRRQAAVEGARLAFDFVEALATARIAIGASP